MSLREELLEYMNKITVPEELSPAKMGQAIFPDSYNSSKKSPVSKGANSAYNPTGEKSSDGLNDEIKKKQQTEQKPLLSVPKAEKEPSAPSLIPLPKEEKEQPAPSLIPLPKEEKSASPAVSPEEEEQQPAPPLVLTPPDTANRQTAQDSETSKPSAAEAPKSEEKKGFKLDAYSFMKIVRSQKLTGKEFLELMGNSRMSNKAFLERRNLPVFCSISMSLTSTSSPSLRMPSKLSRRLHSTSEMCNKPSLPGNISTKAPNAMIDFTTPW